MTDQFKIVKIIDEYTVIINAGLNNYVNIGDKFQILDEEGSEVKDPDTGELLGYMHSIKDTVIVSEVLEKMCYCSSNSLTSDALLSSIYKVGDNLNFSQKKRLNIDYTQVTGGLRLSNKPIQVGDTVKLIKTPK